MPTNKTTVTIAELCEKHWPEGCKYFSKRGGRLYFDSPFNNGTSLNVLSANGEECENFAAAAAQHFRNKAKARRKNMHALEKAKGVFNQIKYVEEQREFLAEMKRAELWEELTNDL